jgi:hypothetical protein
MPADFEKCRAEGGHIITKKLNASEYMHICWDKAGKSHAGEVREYKKLSKHSK